MLVGLRAPDSEMFESSLVNPWAERCMPFVTNAALSQDPSL